MRRVLILTCLTLILVPVWGAASVSARMLQDKVVPHHQDQLPNDPRTAEEAIQHMTVPEGFRVEVVGQEPDIVNPVAMAFDERGRIWITESLEYPRRSPGPGQDRIKILEDTDHDGKIDSVKVFADGLNIPSGIAVGYGGVWVANSPDLLFLQDTDGDDVADQQEVVVSGFGRDDTHELPNSLTWGPDGYLYGLNGVFNFSKIEQDGHTFDFTCAMFRIDPLTRKFEVFASGTSNPWGIAFDERGEAFVSACVIDHLWHLSEAGYYQRQAGAYPPHTWIMDSIVKHKHFKAAYCGIHYFDSPQFPDNYRRQMYMGNIHGGSINSDAIEKAGASYTSQGNQDLLQANDAWFMPVAQKTAPDGSLYVLDWYDRYHCYQDANRDPKGIDRLKGRLYSVRYGESDYQKTFNLAAESDADLIQRLGSPNVFFRDTAQHVLAYRISQEKAEESTVEKLLALARSAEVSQWRRRAAWTLVSSRQLDLEQWKNLVAADDAVVRTFAVRMAGNLATHRDPEIAALWRSQFAGQLSPLASDPELQVRLAVMVAARKILGSDAVPVILQAGKDQPQPGADLVLAQLTWQNLLPLLQSDPQVARQLTETDLLANHPSVQALVQRLTNILLQQGSLDGPLRLLARLNGAESQPVVDSILGSIRDKVLNGELSVDVLVANREKLLSVGTASSHREALMAIGGDSEALERQMKNFLNREQPDAERAATFAVLCFMAKQGNANPTLNVAGQVLDEENLSPQLAAAIVDSLLQVPTEGVAELLLKAYQKLNPATRSRVVESLTSRPDWARQLFEVLGQEPGIPVNAVNETQVRRLLARNDSTLNDLIEKNWGKLNLESRGTKIDEMLRVRRLVRDLKGDVERGWAVYDRVCGQCHEFTGRGQAVGPALDANGRASLTQLISNMVDPNLVIGKDYQARLVATVDGRIFSGLVVEESPQRLVLNTQGGKRVTLPTEDIEEMKTSELSLMPEGQTQQMTDQEIADLMSLLVQVNPKDPSMGRLPETRVQQRDQWDGRRYNEILPEAFADFMTYQGFENGLGLIAEHRGRQGVVRTHPESREKATRLSRKVKLPADTPMQLNIGASHHNQGNWELRVLVNQKPVEVATIGAETCTDGWYDLQIDLSDHAGQEVTLTLENAANDWAYEFAYWSHAYLSPIVEEAP